MNGGHWIGKDQNANSPLVFLMLEAHNEIAIARTNLENNIYIYSKHKEVEENKIKSKYKHLVDVVFYCCQNGPPFTKWSPPTA